MTTRHQLRINCTKTTQKKYRRVAKEARKFTKIFNKFIRESGQMETVEDYVMAMRTHLFMKTFRLKLINSYINEVITPQMNELIKKNIRVFEKNAKELKYEES